MTDRAAASLPAGAARGAAFMESLCPGRNFPWNLNWDLSHIGATQFRVLEPWRWAGSFVVWKVTNGGGAAEIVLRSSGPCPAGPVRTAASWLCDAVHEPQFHGPTPRDFAAALLVFLGWSLGWAFLVVGPGLFKLVPSRRVTGAFTHDAKDLPMNDLIWLGVLAGLFLLTLAFVRLCSDA